MIPAQTARRATLALMLAMVPVLALGASEPSVSVTYDEARKAAHIVASIDIAAPPAAVFKVMQDCAATKRIVSGLEVCRVISSAGNSDVREQVLAGNIIAPRMRYVFRSNYQQNRAIRFSRVDGDFTVMQGEWSFQPMGDGTKVHYSAYLAIETMIPGPLVRAAIANDMPNTLRNLRRESLAAVGTGG